jgi:hypothetical protein
VGNIKQLVLVSTICSGLVSCASNPDNINSAYISPLKYSSYNCNQLSSELDYVGQRTNALYLSLKKKRTADNWQMGVGMLVFWPTLFALEGGDGPEAAEYSQLKGEYEALRTTAVQKRCGLAMQSPDEIVKAARKAGEQSTESADQSTSVGENLPDAPTQTATGTKESTPLSERLRELQKLREDGLITEKDYEAAKQKALDI